MVKHSRETSVVSLSDDEEHNRAFTNGHNKKQRLDLPDNYSNEISKELADEVYENLVEEDDEENDEKDDEEDDEEDDESDESDEHDEDDEDEEGENTDYNERELSRSGLDTSVHLTQTLPEDHESVIFNERDQANPLKDINDLFAKLKSECIKANHSTEDVDTCFSCGGLLKDDAPDVAINVEGVVGPITFPLDSRDITRILDCFKVTSTDTKCLDFDMSKIVMNLNFQEYVNDAVLSDATTYLGVEDEVAKTSRLQAHRFYLCGKGGQIELPDHASLKGAYGTVVVYLPSEFYGGEISTEYKGVDIAFQPCTSAHSECYFVAWYNDVKHDFSPVVGGHSAFITFSLVSDHEDASKTNIQYLQERRIEGEDGLLSAENKVKSEPYIEAATAFFKNMPKPKYPIFYMLDYTYPSPNTEIEDLKRCDKTLANIFKSITEDIEYCMYLGTVEREVEAAVTGLKEQGEGSEKDCQMDEEGIYLADTTVYDKYTITQILDEYGENILKNPIGIDIQEQITNIQGLAWYAGCKPETQDIITKNNNIIVKSWYSSASALVFFPKESKNFMIELSEKSDY